MNPFILAHVYRAYKNTALYEKIKNDNLMIEATSFDYYCYKYKDDRVESLVKFLFLYLNRPTMIDNSYFESAYYFHGVFSLFAHYRHICKKISGFDDEIINESEQLIIEKNKEFNDVCYQWFLEMLQLTFNKWDEKEAFKICEKYNILSIMETHTKECDLIKMKLNLNLLRKNSQMEKYLL